MHVRNTPVLDMEEPVSMKLSANQRAVLTRLVESRDALRRELEATEQGITAVVQVIYGDTRTDLRLDLDSWEILCVRTPEDAARELMERIDETWRSPEGGA